MSGLDRIIEKINSDSATRCEEILAAATAECEKIAAAAKQQGESDAKATIAAASKKADVIVSMAKSGSQQKAQQAVLAAKIKLIDSVLLSALSKLEALDSDRYFAALTSIAKQKAQQKPGVMYFNSADLKRLPQGFEADLNAQGVNVTISNESRKIGAGFVLAYGNIEENCTFAAMLDEKRDLLKEKICEIIF